MSRTGRWIVCGIIGIVAVGVLVKVVGAQEVPDPAIAPTPIASSAATMSPTASGSATMVTTETSVAGSGFVVVMVVDGDTVRVRPIGSVDEQRVRLIGVDAPETGTCEATAATTALEEIVLNRAVTLTMGGDGEDLDPYGRALRYVDATDGATIRDAGLTMISGGHAIARYDSRDGYGRHDREEQYIAADMASPAYTCPASTTTRSEDPAPLVAPIPGDEDSDTHVEAPATGQAPAPTGGPSRPPADYPNCAAARAAGAAPLHVGEPGYSSDLDRDDDGVACE